MLKATSFAESWRIAALGLLLLLPAFVLVSPSHLLQLSSTNPLIHPVVILGGLLLAFALNLLPVVRLTLHLEGDILACVIHLKGRWLNLAVVAVSVCLATIIIVYVFVENFQIIPR